MGLTCRGGVVVVSDRVEVGTPVVVDLLGFGVTARAYDSIEERDGAVVGRAAVELPDGSVVVVTDVYSGGEVVDVSRRVEVTAVGTAAGIRVGWAAVTAVPDVREWQFFLPGTLYNRNDTDHDGVKDYLGTYEQSLRDDKNGVLAALAFGGGTAVSLARTSIPALDTAVTAEDLERRYFVQRTDIGSLGLAPRGDQVELRASWPFAEEHVQPGHGRDGLGGVRAAGGRDGGGGDLPAAGRHSCGSHRGDLGSGRRPGSGSGPFSCPDRRRTGRGSGRTTRRGRGSPNRSSGSVRPRRSGPVARSSRSRCWPCCTG